MGWIGDKLPPGTSVGLGEEYQPFRPGKSLPSIASRTALTLPLGYDLLALALQGEDAVKHCANRKRQRAYGDNDHGGSGENLTQRGLLAIRTAPIMGAIDLPCLKDRLVQRAEDIAVNEYGVISNIWRIYSPSVLSFDLISYF